jgi:hypothetical protein
MRTSQGLARAFSPRLDLVHSRRLKGDVGDARNRAEAAALPRCLAAEARVDCSHVSRAPTRTHPLRVGRGASDPLGVRSSRRGSGCGGVRRVPRVHCGLHRRVAPQGSRRSSQRRPVRPRRLVRGLVLDRRVDSLLHRGTTSGAASAAARRKLARRSATGERRLDGGSSVGGSSRRDRSASPLHGRCDGRGHLAAANRQPRWRAASRAGRGSVASPGG